MNTLLASRLQAAQAPDLEDHENDVRWRFVLHTLSTLSGLRDDPSSPIPLFSVKDSQNVSSVLQMVVALGLIPSLIPGVGLAPEKRSKFVQCLQEQGEEKEPLGIEEVLPYLHPFYLLACCSFTQSIFLCFCSRNTDVWCT